MAVGDCPDEGQAKPGTAPVAKRSKMCSSSAGAMPVPVSCTTRLTTPATSSRITDSRMRSSGSVCCVAFSSSASIARLSRSASAIAVASSSWPSCQCRPTVGRQRQSASVMNISSSTGSGWRNSGTDEAAIRSSRSLSVRSRFSSPTTTSISRRSWFSTRLLASSSECPSAIVIGVLSWWLASCRKRRWVASRRSFSSLTRMRSELADSRR
jgi:hypothetical protein